MSTAIIRNEGVGQGGFIGNFLNAGQVILESWNPDSPASHVIDQPDQFGGATPGVSKWAAVAGFRTASALAQMPFDGVTLTKILQGDQVTAPADHGGGTWTVINVGESYQVGDYFKCNLGLKLNYN